MQREIDCLVTGATGFLGRAVVNGLLANGASVRCLIRPGYNLLPELALATRLGQSANSHMVQGNLLSPEHTAQAVDGVRVVYHLAAETRGLPATVFAGTVVGSQNLFRAILRARPQRVVLISSLNVYGLANATPQGHRRRRCGPRAAPWRRDAYTHAKTGKSSSFRNIWLAAALNSGSCARATSMDPDEDSCQSGSDWLGGLTSASCGRSWQ